EVPFVAAKAAPQNSANITHAAPTRYPKGPGPFDRDVPCLAGSVPAVNEPHNRGMAAHSGERRIVSVLLADVADSTTIGEQLGPERSKFLFDEVTRLLAGEVKRFGGTVAQLTGDGLYALFGVPNAHDDDAERAVRAALAMQAALAAYAKDVGEAYGVELAGRVGVNT